MEEKVFPVVQVRRLVGFEKPSESITQHWKQDNYSIQKRFPVVKLTRLPQLYESCSTVHIIKKENYSLQKRFPVVKLTRLPQLYESCSTVHIIKKENYSLQKRFPVVKLQPLTQSYESCSSAHVKKQKNHANNGVEKQKYPVVKITRLPESDVRCSSIKKQAKNAECHQDQVFLRHRSQRNGLSTCFNSIKINSFEVDILEENTFDCNNSKSFEYSHFFQQRLFKYEHTLSSRMSSCKRLLGKRRKQSIKLHSCTIRNKLFLFENHLPQKQCIHLRQKSMKSLNFNSSFTVKKCTVKVERLRVSSSFTQSTYNENLSSALQCNIPSLNSYSLREITSNDLVGTESDVGSEKMLSDDELWARLEKLNSNNILVLHPAVCLKATLSDEEDIGNILTDINGSKHIIAPISNASSDKLTGYNTEGTHWSLIIVDIDRQQYYHLDSLPGLNHASALQFCKNVNVLLKLKPFKFITKKCKQQSDNYSCGWEVIKNAKKQVYFLKNRISHTQITKSKKVIGRHTLYMTCKPKLVRL